MGLPFNTFPATGTSHIIPGAYSNFDAIRSATGLASTNNGVVMGASTGGQPVTLLEFRTLTDAVAVLRSGPLMEAVRLAFNPGGGLNPQRVFALRVNSALQALSNLQSGANDILELKSRDWGVYTNQIRVTISDGTNFGKKALLEFQTRVSEEFDDIRGQSLMIQTTNGNTSATLTIINNDSVQTLTTQIDGTGTQITINLADYQTIGELVAYLNDQAGYTVTSIPGQENNSPLELDAVDAIDIKTTAIILESSLQAMIDIINSQSRLVRAQAINGAQNRMIVDNVGPVFLAGGSEGTYTAADWANALSQLEAEDVQFISTPDSSASIHAAIKTHCEFMSRVTQRRERQFLVGAPEKTPSLAADIDNAISAAVELNSLNGMYVFNGGTQRDVNGRVREYSAAFAACMLMGIKIALPIHQPLTYKDVEFISLDWKLTQTQVEKLLSNGVAPLNYSSAGLPQLVRQFNTYQEDELIRNEFSVVTEIFFVSRDLRQFLESRFVGQPTTNVVGGCFARVC